MIKIFRVLLLFLIPISCHSTGGIVHHNDIKISKLADGVWVHTSHYIYPNGFKMSSNGMIVQNNDSLILIDTAWGELKTLELLNKIKVKINLPIKKALITHSHGDRASGVDILKSAGIKVYSHPKTRKFTVQQGTAVPNEVFYQLREPGSSIKFSDVEVSYLGHAHTEDNLVVWLPKSKILFGGCSIRALKAKSLGSTADSDINSWLDVIEHLNSKYKNIFVVPGHGQVGGKNLLTHTEKLLKQHMQNSLN
ncbi:subclass B1 metallo-beta-lactamase [Pseudoalteromonas phenolica]|uniref:beta-lactamase n=1 Tax=Pseudoalteromonas phenolica TaxID=161398 RepID=A0A5R9Q7H6_9GAMM|nr:subclass B1 metallo-beta-lactamase [Pseudoalteromonas phenolica]TLX48602.1 subclass B1 metallo-beta-lactamase [Pseudoalteromonas phenolica]